MYTHNLDSTINTFLNILQDFDFQQCEIYIFFGFWHKCEEKVMYVGMYIYTYSFFIKI